MKNYFSFILAITFLFAGSSLHAAPAPSPFVQLGRISTYEPFNPGLHEQTYHETECPEGHFVTGVLVAWRQKDVADYDQCYWDGGNKRSCGFLYLDECKTCATGDDITKSHVFIKEVFCSDGSKKPGVPLPSHGAEKLLSCAPGSYATGVEGIVTSPNIVRHAAFLDIRLHCAESTQIQPGGNLAGATEGYGLTDNWEEELGSWQFEAKTRTAPDFVCDDGCKGEYGWGSGDEPSSRKFKVSVDTKKVARHCPAGFALRTLYHHYNGPSFYDLSGGDCWPVIPEAVDPREETFERMKGFDMKAATEDWLHSEEAAELHKKMLEDSLSLAEPEAEAVPAPEEKKPEEAGEEVVLAEEACPEGQVADGYGNCRNLGEEEENLNGNGDGGGQVAGEDENEEEVIPPPPADQKSEASNQGDDAESDGGGSDGGSWISCSLNPTKSPPAGTGFEILFLVGIVALLRRVLPASSKNSGFHFSWKQNKNNRF